MGKSRTEVAKKLQKLLAEGTPRQKALLVCENSRTLNDTGTEPIITDDDLQAIRASLKDNEELKEYNKWIGIHQVYSDLTPAFGVLTKGYEAELHTMRCYLTRWEDYTQEENHLNIIYRGLLDAGDEQAIETFREKVKRLTFINAKVELTDKEVTINIDELYSRIEIRKAELLYAYGMAKALVLETEKFKRRTRSAGFTLEAIDFSIKEIKENPNIKGLEKYSRKQLQEDIAEGMKITTGDRKRAILPYYEEVEPNEQAQEYFNNEYNKRYKWYVQNK